MAKDAKKVQTKAKINWGWNAPEDRDGKATRTTRSQRSTSRQIKKLGLKAILIILLVTVVGVGVGMGACWILSRNDCFTIIGDEEITLTLKGEDEALTSKHCYYDKGVKVVSFGRNISEDVYIETDLKRSPDGGFYAEEAGTYYIIYKVDDIKYGKIFTVQRIRLITFVESTPNNVVD